MTKNLKIARGDVLANKSALAKEQRNSQEITISLLGHKQQILKESWRLTALFEELIQSCDDMNHLQVERAAHKAECPGKTTEQNYEIQIQMLRAKVRRMKGWGSQDKPWLDRKIS